MGVCYLSCMALLFSIRVLLARENKRRDAEPPDHTFDDFYIVTTDEDGNRTEVKVPKVRICSPLINLYFSRSSSWGAANRSS